MPDSVPKTLTETFNSLFPITVMAVGVALISTFITHFTGVTFPEMVLNALAPVISAFDNLFSTTLLIVLQQVLWWFGIHDLALGAVLDPIRLGNEMVNAAAYAQGTPLTELPHILTDSYWFVFLNIGGYGQHLWFVYSAAAVKGKALSDHRQAGDCACVFQYQ